MKRLSSLLIAAIISAIGLVTVAQADDYTNGLYNKWVGDDYSDGSFDWFDEISDVDAAQDGLPLSPITVSQVGLLGGHTGVEIDPGGGANDAGFNIIGSNPPTGYTNYTVAVVVVPTLQGPNNPNYYGSQLIIGYDIGGAGQTDWGISWGGTNSQNFVAGIGLANGNDQGLETKAVSLNETHAVALQVGNGTMSMYLDGALASQATGLPLHAPNAPAIIALLSTLGNISQVFPGPVAEVRIYTNSTVDAAGLTAYLDTVYNYSTAISFSTNAAGAIVGSNAVVTMTVPANVTESSPLTIAVTSGNTAVTASQTITLPVGVSSTNLNFPILTTGVSTVTATATGLSLASAQITGALPTITFTPASASAAVGSSAAATLTLACPYPFSGPYTVTLTSDNSGVAVGGQTITFPAGVISTNLTFSILATGYAGLTADGTGLNEGALYVGTLPEIYTVGMYNEWAGDDYSAGSDWIDRFGQVDAGLDGSANPPISVSETGFLGGHKGVQRDPSGTNDGGFNISAGNPPTGYTNYTVVATVYPTAQGPNNANYYGAQLIVGYDIGGAGQADWGISWGGTNSQSFVAGIGLANGSDQGLETPVASLNAVHAVALQVGNGTMRMYLDGALVSQHTSLPLHAPAPPTALPLLSTVNANIGNAFPGVLADLRIYTNTDVDAAGLTAYLDNYYSYSESISFNTNAAGAIVGSNVVVTLSVPANVTASSPLTITLTSGNTGVAASQTITLPEGVSSTNLSLPIIGVGTSTVDASAPGLALAKLQITGALPSIAFAPLSASAAVGDNAKTTLKLTCPYPFSGPYTVTLISDNSGVAAGQTITLPAGVASTNLTIPILATGVANLAGAGTGLNPAIIGVGTIPELYADGIYNDWVGDDYVSGNGWTDRVSQVVAALDGGTTPPISVSGLFGSHEGVQRDPNGGANDAGFSIPAANPPTGYTNYTVAVTFDSMATGPINGAYYGSQLIIGYDIGGAGQTDWGLSWGGTTGSGIALGMGLSNGGDELMNTPSMTINTVHTVAVQVSKNVTGDNTASLYLDGVLVSQATGLPLKPVANSNGTGVIPLLSSVDSNIGNTFPGAVGEVRIFTNAVVDAASLTAYMQTNHGGSLLVLTPPTPTILPVHLDATGTNLVLSVATQAGHNYLLESTTNLTPPIVWTTNSTTVGTGATITNMAPVNSTMPNMFFRYMVQ
jgi:Concanavalin A-like lectin/glucanases superfamily